MAAGGVEGVRGDIVQTIVDRAHTLALQAYADSARELRVYTIASVLRDAPNDDNVKAVLVGKLGREFAKEYKKQRLQPFPPVSCREGMSILGALHSSYFFNNDRREQFIAVLAESLATSCEIYGRDPSPARLARAVRVVANVEFVFLDMRIEAAISLAFHRVGMQAPPDAIFTVIDRTRRCLFVKTSIHDERHIIETPPSLEAAWGDHRDALASVVEDNFTGVTCVNNTEGGIKTLLKVAPSIMPATTSGGVGASASASRETYHFECQIQIHRLTSRQSFTPPTDPADIKQRMDALPWDHRARDFTHYVDYVALGAFITVAIQFNFTSKTAAQDAHIELNGASSIEAAISVSRKAGSLYAKLSVRSAQHGFAITEVPPYERHPNILAYYRAISDWARATDVSVPEILYLHAKPVSSVALGLRDIIHIQDYYRQISMKAFIATIVQESGLSESTPGISVQRALEMMAEARVIIPEADEINFRSPVERSVFLRRGDDGKMVFADSPSNCTLKLVPADGAPLLTANTGNFSIQVWNGRDLQGYLIAERAGKPGSHYRLRLHPERQEGKEHLYRFQLRDLGVGGVERSHPATKKVTAEPAERTDAISIGRVYYLVAPTVSSRIFSGPVVKEHFLTEGDGKACSFEMLDRKTSDPISFCIEFVHAAYLGRLASAFGRTLPVEAMAFANPEGAARIIAIRMQHTAARFGDLQPTAGGSGYSEEKGR
jgi:hypothetical protein